MHQGDKEARLCKDTQFTPTMDLQFLENGQGDEMVNGLDEGCDRVHLFAILATCHVAVSDVCETATVFLCNRHDLVSALLFIIV